MPMSDAVSSEGPKTSGIQQRSLGLSLTHRYFSSLSESFDYVMHCRWRDLQSLYNLTLRNVVLNVSHNLFKHSFTRSQIGEPLPIFTYERLFLLILLWGCTRTCSYAWWRVGEVANRVSCGSFRGGHWYLPIRNHDNRYFADWIRLFPGLSKNSENGNSCPKPHKAARMIEAVGRAVSIETEL